MVDGYVGPTTALPGREGGRRKGMKTLVSSRSGMSLLSLPVLSRVLTGFNLYRRPFARKIFSIHAPKLIEEYKYKYMY
jgi:hypothetical protein